jgi:hypothetical protein
MRPLGGATRSEPARKTMAEGTGNWPLVLEAARAQTAAGRTHSPGIGVYERIWQRHPRSSHARPSLDPTFQGMVHGTTGGPKSLAGAAREENRYGCARPGAHHWQGGY